MRCGEVAQSLHKLASQARASSALLPLTCGKFSIFSPTHPTTSTRSSHLQLLSPWCGSNHPHPVQTRHLATSSPKLSSLLLPDKTVRSPLPDINIPDNIPVHEIIFDKCDEYKDMPAVSEFLTGRSYTFSQLKDKSIRVASALSKKGYKKGDVVLAFSPNQIDYIVLMLASSCLGVWFSAANPAYTPEDLARHISLSDSVAIFVHPFLAPVAEQALNMNSFPHKIKEKFVFGEVSGYQPFHTLAEDDGKALPDVSLSPKDDVFILPYSSGTTGLPKGVMLSHYNILSNTLQIGQSYKYNPGDNVLGLLPLFHIYGMTIIQFGSLYNGSHLHLLPKFDPESFLACLQDRQINKANLVPPLVLFLTKHPMVASYDLSKLEDVVSGAAPLGQELTNAFVSSFKHKVTVKQGFGLTETSPVTHIDIGQNFGSVGCLVCNTTAKVVDLDSGEVCGPNHQGELCVRGPQVMLGYYNNEKATKDMLTDDGWLYTGDIGYYNEEGIFYICDRLKELIKYKGHQVAPAELEAILVSHPDVADACVVGLADGRAGEVPKAFVVKKPSAVIDECSMAKFVDDQVSDYKKLRGGVEFIQEIPKNPSGKILRKLLRQN